ncbi:MAG: hypothetical protein NW226_15250 [Microscillaceae bacterium]|nr:hypothetical protein [Microscillaceae bacterium]
MMNYSNILFAFVLTFAVLGILNHQTLQAQNTGFVVIVNNDNPVGQMNAGQAKLYYLRKVKKRWPVIEKNIRPVDRTGNPPRQSRFPK